jgi:hypothetical protein
MAVSKHWCGLGLDTNKHEDLNACEKEGRIEYDYQVGQNVLAWNDGILLKADSRNVKEPWTITSVHTNGTIRVQCRNKSERMNIQRVTLFDES